MPYVQVLVTRALPLPLILYLERRKEKANCCFIMRCLTKQKRIFRGEEIGLSITKRFYVCVSHARERRSIDAKDRGKCGMKRVRASKEQLA